MVWCRNRRSEPSPQECARWRKTAAFLSTWSTASNVASLMQAGRRKPMQLPARYSKRLEAKREVVAQLQHS